MTRDEIREIANIVGGDRTYQHFVKRINKEFEASGGDRNSKVYVLYQKAKGEKVGFSVIGESPAKMRVWGKLFRQEGWVDDSFKMNTDAFELMYMYVRPWYRRRGFGKKLFSKIQDFSKKKHVAEIYAYTSEETPDSLSFYKKMRAEVLTSFSDEGATSAFLRWKLQ